MMQPIAGGAPARPFVTHHNALDMDLFLRIAPELYLKRLIVGGFERVYEIKRNFRNEGISTQHNPEFTMLEFYQAYADYHDLMALTEELLVDGRARGDRDRRRVRRSASTRSRSARRSAGCRCAKPRRAAASRPARHAASPSPTCATPGVPRDVALKLGIELAPSTTAPARSPPRSSSALWEEQLVQPTFVHDFPTEVSPLSKQRADDPDTVERFELYVGGFEVANAFSELNDPVEQRRRFEAAARREARRATPRRTRWTRTTSARSSTACRRPAGKGSASTGSSWC